MEDSYINPSVPLTEVEEDEVSQRAPLVYVPPRNKFPILVTLLLIILAFVAAIGVYLFIQVRELNTQLTATPSPLPTIPVASPSNGEGLQTYVNQNLRISFDYPNNWKFDDQAVSDTGTPVYIVSANESIFRIDTFVDDSPTIAQYLVKQDKTASTAWEGTPSLIVKSTKKTVISGNNVIQRVENMAAAGFPLLATYFKSRNVIYRITLENSNADKGNESLNSIDEQIYNEILSTIKFTEATNQTKNTCPESEWVDCMPGPDSGNKYQCTKEYLSWARGNCPGFRGAAL